jgi:fructokinase
MAKHTVLGFGEVLWDLLPAGRQLGGAPLNFIHRVNSLGDKGWMASRIGRDELGDEILTRMLDLGMDPALVQRDDRHPTGTVRVQFDADQQPDYEILPDVAYDFIEPEEALIRAADQADCVCFGTLAQRSEVSRRTCRQVLNNVQDGLKLLDVNLRRDCYDPSVLESSLSAADVAKLNDAEAVQLSEMFQLGRTDLDAIAASLIDRFALRCCVITAGARGALAVSNEPRAVYEPGFAAPPGGDAVGAGDAFTAGFVHKILRQAPLAECVRYGNAVGALVAGQPGGTGPLDRKQIEQFLTSSPQRNVDPTLSGLAR